MKLEEMIRRCALLMGLDTAFADQDAVRTESEQSVYDRLKMGINEAYHKVAVNVLRPIAEQEVQLDQACCFEIDGLEKCFADICRIRVNGHERRFRELAGRIQVFASPGSTAAVSYYYVPEKLEQPEDEPVLSEQEVPAVVYIYGALSLYATGEGKFYEAATWDERFLNAVSNVHRLSRRCRMPARRWI